MLMEFICLKIKQRILLLFFTGKSGYVKYKIPVTLFESVYYPGYINLLVCGTTDSGNSETILYTSYATNSGEYEFPIKNSLEKFKKKLGLKRNFIFVIIR